MNSEEKKKEMLGIELSIGKALRIGVILATIVMVFGVILLVIKGGETGYSANYIPIRPTEIIAGIGLLKPFAVMMLGLFLLIMTPVLRVIVSIYAFVAEHDYLYVVITSVVLVILVISMLIGYFTA